MDYDVTIIGAGVVGLAMARMLSSKGLQTLVVERHSSFGQETSSRNSEVIHAGIYYPKNSLKAELCVAGNKSLYQWCRTHEVPFQQIGKFIVATNTTELEQLDGILERAKANGVEGIRSVGKDELHQKEPNVNAIGALFSPNTGIVDSHKLMQSLYQESRSFDCDYAWKHTLEKIQPLDKGGYSLGIKDPIGDVCKITTKFIVNAAGLDADTVAEFAGIDIDKHNYRVHYCRGHYFRLSNSKAGLINHLVYPVPNKNVLDLGLHLTLDLNGGIKLGPDVHFLDKREQDYSVPEELKQVFYNVARKYINGIELQDLSPDQSGIRPKLQTEGGEFRDFIIQEESEKGLPGLVNLIGIESPGLTSCLEISRKVAELLAIED